MLRIQIYPKVDGCPYNLAWPTRASEDNDSNDDEEFDQDQDHIGADTDDASDVFRHIKSVPILIVMMKRVRFEMQIGSWMQQFRIVVRIK